ncbi:guanylate kinase [candidate division KSB1 bacterium]
MTHTDLKITRPTLLVLSGFSGTGKTTVRDRIQQLLPGTKFSVSTTTRQKRNNEKEGIDYNFVSADDFKNKIDNGELIEWEEVHGNYYGTPAAEIEKALRKSGLVIFDVDVYGGISIKKRCSEAVLVFIKTPSVDELKRRLRKRHSDSEEEIEKRISRVPEEEELSKKYDYIVINNDIEQTVGEVFNIIKNFQLNKT